MTFPLIQANAGPIPARISIPLAKSQTFTNLALIGVSNGTYAGGAGYGLPINSTNAPYIAFAVGEFMSGTPGTNGAFTSSSQAGIYTPVVTPSTSDGLYSANVHTGAAMMLPDTSAPTGYTNCSLATNNQPVYTTDGQSVVCFLGATGPAAALTAGYVLAGKQLSYNQDGNNQVEVLCQPWLNSGVSAIVSALVVVTASASSVVLAGAAVGDTVVATLDLTTGANVPSAYEAVITVAGHIQQIVASGSGGVSTSDKVFVLLQRGSA